MPLPSSRRVRRLHLHVAHRDDVWPGAILIEDALRTASFPLADQGHLLLIRRLALGRIHRNASPGTVALQIERAYRKAEAQAVPFETSAAAAAEVVVIPNHVAGLTRLAHQLGRGIATTEWFWAKLIPDWNPDAGNAEKWRCLLDAALALPERILAQAAIVSEAVTAHAEGELLQAMRPGQGTALLEAAGWRGANRPSEIAERAGARRLLPDRIMHRVLSRPLPPDDRLVWLLTLLAVHEQPSRAANPHLAGNIRHWLDDERRARPEDRSDSVDPPAPASYTQADAVERLDPDATPPAAPARTHAAEETPASPLAAPLPSHLDPQTPTPPWQGDEKDPLPSVLPQQDVAREPDPAEPFNEPTRRTNQSGLQRTQTGAFTHCAGLLFLVPVLERLGLSTWITEEPALLEAGFPAKLLRCIGDAAEVPPDDPLLEMLSELGGPTPLPSQIGVPPPIQALLASPKPRRPLLEPFDPWLTALHRWCRRRARIGLFTLIRRPGRVLASRTHIDLFFDLEHLDLRVRRLALDVDPGWVPWLGRMVHFHYLDPHEHNG